MTEYRDQLREIDQVVLQKVAEGVDTTHKISEVTTFETHRVRYSLKKLDGLGLLKLEKQDGTVERIVDGQRRVFQSPLQGELTDKGRQYVEEVEQENTGRYEDLSHSELVEKVHRLEQETEDLRQDIRYFPTGVRAGAKALI